MKTLSSSEVVVKNYMKLWTNEARGGAKNERH
jgi:hypothetical protein